MLLKKTDEEKTRLSNRPIQTTFKTPLTHYAGSDMRKGHAHLVARWLNDSHFDAVVEDLVAALQELNVPPDLIGQVGVVWESVRADVLGK